MELLMKQLQLNQLWGVYQLPHFLQKVLNRRSKVELKNQSCLN